MKALTIARDGEHYALYRTDSGDTWALAASGTGEDANAKGLVAALAGDDVTVTETDAPHLHVAGEWLASTSRISDPNVRDLLAAEVLNLDKAAATKAENAAYGGEWSDGGAHHLRDEADTIRRVYRLITGDTLPARADSRF